MSNEDRGLELYIQADADILIYMIKSATAIVAEGSLLPSRDVVIAAESFLVTEFNCAEKRRKASRMPKLG